MEYLKDKKTAQEYKFALSNRFKVIQELYDEDEGVNIDRHWSHIKEAVSTTCEEVLGKRKPQQKCYTVILRKSGKKKKFQQNGKKAT